MLVVILMIFYISFATVQCGGDDVDSSRSNVTLFVEAATILPPPTSTKSLDMVESSIEKKMLVQPPIASSSSSSPPQHKQNQDDALMVMVKNSTKKNNNNHNNNNNNNNTNNRNNNNNNNNETMTTEMISIDLVTKKQMEKTSFKLDDTKNVVSNSTMNNKTSISTSTSTSTAVVAVTVAADTEEKSQTKETDGDEQLLKPRFISRIRSSMYALRFFIRNMLLTAQFYNPELSLGRCMVKYARSQYPQMMETPLSMETVMSYVQTIGMQMFRFVKEMVDEYRDDVQLERERIGAKVAEVTSSNDDYGGLPIVVKGGQPINTNTADDIEFTGDGYKNQNENQEVPIFINNGSDVRSRFRGGIGNLPLPSGYTQRRWFDNDIDGGEQRSSSNNDDQTVNTIGADGEFEELRNDRHQKSSRRIDNFNIDDVVAVQKTTDEEGRRRNDDNDSDIDTGDGRDYDADVSHSEKIETYQSIGNINLGEKLKNQQDSNINERLSKVYIIDDKDVKSNRVKLSRKPVTTQPPKVKQEPLSILYVGPRSARQLTWNSAPYSSSVVQWQRQQFELQKQQEQQQLSSQSSNNNDQQQQYTQPVYQNIYSPQVPPPSSSPQTSSFQSFAESNNINNDVVDLNFKIVNDKIRENSSPSPLPPPLPPPPQQNQIVDPFINEITTTNVDDLNGDDGNNRIVGSSVYGETNNIEFTNSGGVVDGGAGATITSQIADSDVNVVDETSGIDVVGGVGGGGGNVDGNSIAGNGNGGGESIFDFENIILESLGLNPKAVKSSSWTRCAQNYVMDILWRMLEQSVAT